MAKEFGQRL